MKLTATELGFVELIIAAHRAVTEPSVVCHLGVNFEVDPNVFSPFMAPSGVVGLAFGGLPIFQGKRVLDVGCGAGVLAALAALSGARSVVGVDINPAAVDNAVKNARIANVSSIVDIRQGDLLQPVAGMEDFDVIFADLPFTSGVPADALERAFFDPDLDSIRRLLRELPQRLDRVSGSRAFICGSSLEPIESILTNVMPAWVQIRKFMSIQTGEMALVLYELSVA